MNESDLEVGISQIDAAIAAVAEAVRQEKEADPAFSSHRYFKDAKTKTKLQKVASELITQTLLADIAWLISRLVR